MQNSLLETKLRIPPTRTGLLNRERLTERLQFTLDKKLMLISAPAGYGKTTLISSWAARQANPVAWFSIDEADNDPVRFLSYLIGALQRAEKSLGLAALALLQSPPVPITGSGGDAAETGPFENCLGALIEDLLRAPCSLILVLDDYHLIQAEPIHQLLRTLLEHQPEQLTLLISGRADPPLNLPRLRARDQLIEIRERDLRFTLEEAAEFLKGLHLSPEAIALLKRRTEGWAAGLQLAALSLQGLENTAPFLHAFAGDDRQVADYLFDEVFRHQPVDVQDFLLHTALLNQLNGSLCDAILQNLGLPKSSQVYLETLDTAQLFLIPLDNKREWYRYHNLFADFLKTGLKKTHPERLAGLHASASQWHEQAGDVLEAVEHAFAVPDFARVTHLMEQYGTVMVYGGQIATYLGWIARIPPGEIFGQAHLCVDCSWAFALSGQIDLAERFARAGKEASATAQPRYIASRGQVIKPDEVLGDLSSVQAYCARLRGDSQGVRRYSQEALRQLPADAYTVRGVVALNLGLEYFQSWEWAQAREAFTESVEMTLKSRENIYVAIVALCMQGSIEVHRGALGQARQFFSQAIALGEENALSASGAIPAICLAHRGLAEIHILRNETGPAAQALETALELARQAGNVDMLYNSLQLNAWLALQGGDLLVAEKALRLVEQHFPKTLDIKSDPDVLALQVEFLLRQGKARTALADLNERGISLTHANLLDRDAKETWKHLYIYVQLGRALLLENRPKEALQLMEILLPVVETSLEMAFLLETYLLLAVLEAQRNNPQHARAWLQKAIQLAGPSGFVSPFLRLRQPLYQFLRQELLSGQIESDNGQKILAALAGQNRQLDAGFLTETSPAPGLETLTRQEMQVLRLLAQGLSSTQVAAELVIAVSTARSYIKNIHRKLNAHSREEALAHGKQLGLL